MQNIHAFFALMYLFLCWTFNTRSCVINWFIAVSTDSKLAIRVFEHLPCWSKLTGLQLCQIFAFFGGSIYCLSCKIHYKAKDASLGKIPFIKALLVLSLQLVLESISKWHAFGRHFICNSIRDIDQLISGIVFLSYTTCIWVEEVGGYKPWERNTNRARYFV